MADPVIPAGDRVNYIFQFSSTGAALTDPIVGSYPSVETLLFTAPNTAIPMAGYQPMITQPGPIIDALYNHPNLILAMDPSQGVNAVLATTLTDQQLATLSIVQSNVGTLIGATQVAQYHAPAVHFDGNTVLSLPGIVTKSQGAARFSFSGWFKSNWNGNQTAYIINPNSFATPFLQSQSPLTFVMQKAESYNSGGTQVGPAQIYYSTDAKNWRLATTPLDGLTLLKAGGFIGGSDALSAINWDGTSFNGIFMYNFQYSPPVPGNQDIPQLVNGVIYSYDGVKWQVAWQPNASQIASGLWFMAPNNFSNPWVLNGLQLSNVNFVPPGQGITPFTSCINAAIAAPADPHNYPAGGDHLTPNAAPLFTQIIVDKSQPAGVGILCSYANNPLPAGITAVRLRQDSNRINLMVDYTQTTITQAIINSGNDLPAATWVNSFNMAANGGTLLYGPATGKNSTSIAVLDSDYSSMGVQQNLPVPANVSGWVNIIGRISIPGGIAELYFNGQRGGNFYSNNPVSLALNDGDLFIGGDTFGNNYVGDMAEFYFFPDVFLSDINGSMAGVLPYFITNRGTPQNPQVILGTIPFSSGTPLGILVSDLNPSVLLSGSRFVFPLNDSGYTQVSANVISGALTDASTSPSDIGL